MHIIQALLNAGADPSLVCRKDDRNFFAWESTDRADVRNITIEAMREWGYNPDLTNQDIVIDPTNMEYMRCNQTKITHGVDSTRIADFMICVKKMLRYKYFNRFFYFI